ncbi:hypothetical protein [Nannocystis radixulma]|uniref:Uncharacterized protein n=1 Tax=Nannocystis radixulma TaxID=2995305 RepID=A0ABT5B5E4_9BACT|nr:hypothetical protein [Nannocystis radixulma]MDC0669343.1 hypothetical protein [Nannocystis radixulma]
MTNSRLAVLLTGAVLSGCLDAPAWENFPKPGSSATEAESSTTSTGEWPTDTTGSGGILTTTIDPTPTSTTADSTDTAAPPGPSIVGHVLGPDPLNFAGPIAVSIATEHADGVRIQVDDEAPLELAMSAADMFAGEILMVSSLSNGTHSATFTAWRDGLESEPLTLPFEVALPAMGSEQFWESGPLIGKGAIAAVAAAPTREVLEFGTFQPMNQPRCYLRRRDLAGLWGEDDFFVVLDGTNCSAIDMEVTAAGEIFMLVARTDNGDTRWTLNKQASWGAPIENVGQGALDEEAHALALHPDMIAVCGARPQPTLDRDAFAAIFRPNAPGMVKAFDYVAPGKDMHKFSDVARDCVFVGERLALVGETSGPHDDNNIERKRLFVLELAANTLEPKWEVATVGSGTNSGATAVVVDDEGRLFLAGFSCGEPCEAKGALWMHSQGTGLWWPKKLALGVRTRDVAWHPAGYAVVVGSLQDAPLSTIFWAQAWSPGADQPLWTAEHSDAPAFQVAVAAAVGAYGQVFAGGVGALGYPAIAYIAG